MERDQLLAPGEDDVRILAQASNSFRGFCVPTCKRHKQKAKIGFRPTGNLLRINRASGYQHLLGKELPHVADKSIQQSTPRDETTRVYLDDNQRRWHERSSCSCYPNRLVCYDDPLIPNSQGASEVGFVVMDDGSYSYTSATYNYRDRDKSTCCQHFWADIFPICCYCNCGEKILLDGAEGYSSVE